MVDLDVMKRFLDGVLYELRDEDEVYLNFREPQGSEWTHHDGVAKIFAQLDGLLEGLDPATRVDLAARSGEVVVALAAPKEMARYSYKLRLPDGRIVCVAVMSPPGAAEHFMEQAADIPVPGVGGVELIDDPDGGGEETFEPDDAVIDDYMDAIDAAFEADAQVEITDDSEGDEDGDGDEGAVSEDVSEDVRGRADRGHSGRRDEGADAAPRGRDVDPTRGRGVDPEGDGDRAGSGGRPSEPAVVRPVDASVDGRDGRDGRDRPVDAGTVRRLRPAGGEDHDDVSAAEGPAGGPRHAGEGGVEGRLSDGVAARTVTVATHSTAKAKYKWRNVTSTLGQFVEMMLQHPEDPQKDGLCVLQGELIGEERTKKAVRACHFMALDLDTGDDFAEIQKRVRKLGHCAIVYSTHSHQKTRDDVARQQVLKFANGSEIDDAMLARYLREEKGVRRSIANSVRIVDGSLHTESGVRIVFDHAPWPKFRIFFPLRAPFVFAERTADADLQKGLAEWKGKLHGLGEILGVRIDAACVDPSRLFYSPRHRAGEPFVSWAYLTDELLDAERVPTIDSRFGDPYTQAAEFMMGQGGRTPVSEENRWLYGWVKRFNHKFDIGDFLLAELPDYVVGDRPGGEGSTTLCPNHELNSQHSSEGGSGTFCAPPDPIEERPFVWSCSHDHCRDLDKLNFLDMLLREKLVEQRALFNPSYLMLEVGEDPPPEWDEGVRTRRLDDAVSRYDRDEITWSELVEQLVPQWAELEMDVRAQTCARLSRKSKLTPAAVRKVIETAARGDVVETDKRRRLVAGGEEWRETLSYVPVKVGDEYVEVVEPNPFNVAKYLAYHNLLQGRVLFNNLRERPFVLDRLPWDPEGLTYPREWSKGDLASLRCWFHAPGTADQMRIRREDLKDGLDSYFNAHTYDPVRDYLEDCAEAWDGKERLNRWLVDYCGAADVEINRAIGAKWMLSAVARQFQPGCQAKYVLILESAQDAGKSKAFSILGGEWFTEDLKDFSQKDTAQIVATNWIIEMPELASMKRAAQVEEVKAFISKSTEEYRAPYGEYNKKRPRQCVFAGTTNDSSYLTDPTGNVRFWPVRCGRVKADALRRDRDQLWGETTRRYLDGERWWFDYADDYDRELIEALRTAQGEREIEDPLVQKIAFHLAYERPVLDDKGLPLSDWMEVPEREYVERSTPWEGFTAGEMMEALGVDFKNRRGGEIRIGNLMKALGYEHRRDGTGARLTRYWRRQEVSDAA